jgi:two-component sensor histidine kinase/DNA-binding response OmpR family regulator
VHEFAAKLRMKVLIVDDEEEICKRLQRELQKGGYDVEYTTQPVGVVEKLREAKKKGRNYAFDLLLLDLRMPEIDGFTVLKEIREAELGLDVIIITGYGDVDDAIIESIRLGAIDYLKKPISFEELRTAIFRVQEKRAPGNILKYRILVVDDEKDLCALIKCELEKEGYDVAVAYDGVEGLDYFKNHRLDILLADIKMPRMSGLEMLERCRAINPDFVAIIFTGHGNFEKAIKALKLGVFDYLVKPISLEELVISVSKGIDMLLLRRSLLAQRRELEKINEELQREITGHKQTEKTLEYNRRCFHNIVERSADGIIIVDKNGIVRFANSTAEAIFGHKAEELVGEMFGFPVMAKEFMEIDIIRSAGEMGIGEMRVVETEWDGESAYMISIRDITERKTYEEKLQASLREKETLMREIHHRVKNNLQIVSSLLNMQAMAATDEKVIEPLLDSRGRIQTMALIHTLLYQSENLERVDMGVTLRKLVNFQLEIYAKEKKAIATMVSAQWIILPIFQAIPCGLIINELVSNALKHAFKGMSEGKIDVSMRADGDRITLGVKDNGVGIPEDVDIYTTGSLGLPLVKSLAEEQLHGKLKLKQEGGTGICIEFNKIMEE